MARKFSYTPEQIAFLAEHVQGTKYPVLAEMFNARFGCNKTAQMIKGVCMYKGLRNGIDPRFRAGFTPENRFPVWACRRRSRMHPIGSEYINARGFTMIKIANPNQWRAKHIVVWEEENGPLPKGNVVLFANGNRQDFRLDNLIMLTSSEWSYLRMQGKLSDNEDGNRAAILIAKVTARLACLQTKRKS